MSDIVVEMEGISKRFPGVQALDKVDFTCREGEVHALVGENGAGKSTLMKILNRAYLQDAGKIMLRGQEVFLSGPKEAQDHGISTIYQEFNLIPELNVAENIFLGREIKKWKGFVIDPSCARKRSEELLAKLEADIDPRSKISELSVAQQQMVEIGKALSLNASIIIMDEPSASVSGKELDSLFRIIRSLRDDGKAVIYISHHLDEIFEIANRATVLKDGKLAGIVAVKDVDKQSIIKMMVGRPLAETFPRKERGTRKEILALKNVCRGKMLRDISFRAYSGEILGITGLVGSGRTELARVIFGADSFDSGEIYLNGQNIVKSKPKTSISNGVGYLTEDRKKEGLINNSSVRKNLTLLILEEIKKLLFINERRERSLAENCIEKFNIMTPSSEQEVQYLSGGNQQKVILAKCLNANPRLLILDEPTRGIDVGAKAEMYNLMRDLAKQGAAILMISSELPEVLGMSDRILVMHEGQIMGELSSSEATEENIMMMATGQTHGNRKIGETLEPEIP